MAARSMAGVDDIPDMILENILARSTVLEVMTLRLVCKKWKRVIDKPTGRWILLPADDDDHDE